MIPTPASEPTVAAAVSRVSLKLQTDNFSLKAQHTRIGEICRTHNVTVPDEFLLDDGGYSGTNFNRPAFRKVVQLVREGKVGAVVFPYTDRFSRGNIENGLRMIRELREAGAKVILGEIGLITDEAHVTIILSTLLGISQAQRNSIIEKSRMGALQKVKEGQPHGGVPYGYHSVTRAEIVAEAIRAGQDAPDGRLKNYMVRVEKEIAALRLMAELIAGGAGLRAIARELTARGIPTRKGAKEWAPFTVKNILKSDCYHTGEWFYNKRHKIEVKPENWRNADADGKHWSQALRPRSEWVGMKMPGAPVWTKAEHQALLEQLEKNGRAVNGKPAAADGREAMLKSLTICRACGKAVTMWQKTSASHGRRMAWYKCSHRNRIAAGHLCAAIKSVPADVIETSVWNAWVEAMTVELPARVAQYFDDLKREAGDQGSDVLIAQRAKLARTRQAAMDKELEADSEEDRLHYANRAATLKAEIALLDRRIAAVEMATPSIDVSKVQREMMTIAKTRDARVKREALLATVEKIVWAGDETAGEADLYLRVRVANRQRREHDVDTYIPLKIKVLLAA